MSLLIEAIKQEVVKEKNIKNKGLNSYHDLGYNDQWSDSDKGGWSDSWNDGPNHDDSWSDSADDFSNVIEKGKPATITIK